MDKTLADILGATGLPQEIVDSLQEAFDKKVAETREETEMSMREEFARRYEHDKAQLVEAIDRMLTDVISKQEESKQAEVAQFVEARDAFRNALAESRQHYKTKLREHLALTRNFAVAELSKEAAALRAEKKSFTEAKAKIKAELATLKEAAAAEQAARLKKIDEFVVRQVSKELKEFGEDHRALVETRVKLVTESRKKLKEMQTKFIKASAEKVEGMVNESLKREMTQLHEDLERNRQNMFGRRIFEAVAAEYMTSYLAEGTEVRKLQTVLESKTAELAEVKTKLDEVEQKTEVARRKAALAEDRAARTQIMSELLSNLRGEKRAVMEGMLETIKTGNLRTAFTKLLPVVLNENTRKAAGPQGSRKLMEERAPTEKRNVVSVTGDQRTNRLSESAQAEAEVESEIDSDLAHVVRLAGIQK
jgi:hypothetical protein